MVPSQLSGYFGQHPLARVLRRALPAKAFQPLIAALVALGIPAAVAAGWHHLLGRHPIVALLLALGWLAACGIAVAIRKALSGPAQRRLEQAGNAADRMA